ncbi:hypothetical protein OTB20_33130 [Streptomyces sp. H27-H1]|nr:hypothetical protein [Streptomyces sp. H27-H1]
MAQAYGFDGWIVNAETDGGDSELAARMRQFLRALRAAGEPHGLSITWYDAWTGPGTGSCCARSNAAWTRSTSRR